jgi:hypothetical protein
MVRSIIFQNRTPIQENEMKMWNLVLTLALVILAAPLLQAQSETATTTGVPLSTKLDSDVELMFNTIVTSLLQKVPGSTDTTKASLLMDASNMEDGQIQANFVLNTDAAGTPVTQGTLLVQLLANQDTQANVLMESTILIPRTDFIANLQNLINAVLAEKQMNASVAIQDLQTFKDELIRVLESSQPAAKKKRQSFGGGSSANDSSELSTEKVEILKSIIQNSLLVEQGATGQTLTIDVQQIQNQSQDLNNVSEVFSKLAALKKLRVELTEAQAIVSVSSMHSIPQNTIQVYDSYLSQLQSNASGLTSLSSLIQKLGPWVVGRCANAEYRNICIEKLIYSCAKNIDRVANCVADAESIQRAREARAEGDTLGAITNGADALINSTGQKIEDQVDSLINWATGNDGSNSGQEE